SGRGSLGVVALGAVQVAGALKKAAGADARPGIAGIEFSRFVIGCSSAHEIGPALFERLRQRKPGIAQGLPATGTRFQFDGMFEHWNCSRRVSGLSKINPQVQVGFKPVWRQFHSSSVRSNSVAGFRLMALRETEIEPELRVFGLRFTESFQFLFRLGVLVRFEETLGFL